MNKNKIIGIVSIVAAVAGIIVVFTYRAWLGGLIYLVGAVIADIALRGDLKEKTGEEYPNYVVAFITEKKVSLPKYVIEGLKNGDIINKISACIITALPVVVVACVILWITWDSSRTANDMFSAYDYDY